MKSFQSWAFAFKLRTLHEKNISSIIKFQNFSPRKRKSCDGRKVYKEIFFFCKMMSRLKGWMQYWFLCIHINGFEFGLIGLMWMFLRDWVNCLKQIEVNCFNYWVVKSCLNYFFATCTYYLTFAWRWQCNDSAALHLKLLYRWMLKKLFEVPQTSLT